MMADDFDVEAMLEAPYKQDAGDTGREERDRDRDRDGRRNRDRKRSRSRDRKRSRDRDGKRSRDKGRRSRSRDRDGKRLRDKDRKAKSKEREKRQSTRSRSKERERERKKRLTEMTPEERDARTVFCMQLSAKLRPRDLEQFFGAVGTVRDVRIITDNKTRRSKGIAYVEFADVESVPLAMGLAGQRLLGVPIIVQVSQAEKNRSSMTTTGYDGFMNSNGPMRLYVGSLHFNITEDMLRGIFDPFGKVTGVTLMKDSETGRSKGFGFITFQNAEEAKKALEQLNGFELAGRPMKVGHVTEKTPGEMGGGSFFDNDEMDRAGVDLGATGRLQLMAKLAEGTGFQIPQAAANALNMPGGPPMMGLGVPPPPPQAHQAPPIATQCFMLSNMFDPVTEVGMTWEVEVRDDVIEECNKHGGVLHIYVDKASPQGNVYVKCPTITAAAASVNALHGRYFAGRVITAAYVPLPNYHQLFPDALRQTNLLMPSTKNFNALGASSQLAASMPFR